MSVSFNEIICLNKINYDFTLSILCLIPSKLVQFLLDPLSTPIYFVLFSSLKIRKLINFKIVNKKNILF